MSPENFKENMKQNLKKIAKVIMKMLSKIFRKVLIYVVIFILIIMSLAVIFEGVMEGFSSKVSEYVSSNPVEYNTEDNSIVVEDEHVDGLIDLMGTVMDIEQLGMTKEDIKKIYLAELLTQELCRVAPAEQEEGKYYGKVYINRIGASTNDRTLLTYQEYDTFITMGEEIYNYFSIKDDKLCIATIETNAEAQQTVEIHELDYKSKISQYLVPCEFLLDLCAITKNPGFVMALTEKIINETEIIIGVFNEKTIETINTTNTYYLKTDTSTVYKTFDSNGKQTSRNVTTDSSESGPYTETTKQTTETVSPVIKVISAKTWIVDKILTYNQEEYTTTYVIPEDDPSNQIPDEIEGTTVTDTTSGNLEGGGTYKNEITTTTYKINQTRKIEQETTTITYKESAEEQVTEKTAEFIELLNTPFETTNSNTKVPAGGNLKSGAKIFLRMLQNSSRTQSIEQIMRYILYVYTGENYGVTEFDFSWFNEEGFTSILSGGTLINYIKSWENFNLWKYESGYTSVAPTNYINSKGEDECYIVYEDGSAGHNNIAYGVATFISSNSDATTNHSVYGNGYYNWKEEFASYGIDITTLKTGDLVDKQATLAVFSKIIQHFESKVDEYLRTNGIVLEDTQRDALVAVCYQYGNIAGFADAYKTYGNSEELKAAFTTANGATPFNGTDSRKVANWNLFYQGIYSAPDGTEIKSGIVDIADAIHKYMEQNHYVYCVYFSNRYEEHTNSSQCALTTTFEKSKEIKTTCCATYVSWVLQEAGYLTEAEHQDSATNLRNLLRQKGWQTINNVNELQPGDVICYDGHIEIYAGDGKVYNAGSGEVIRKSSPYTKNISSMLYGLRSPE